MKTAEQIARFTLARRVKYEEATLGQMLARGNHKSLSYQSGLVDGMLIAQRITAGLDAAEAADAALPLEDAA